MAKKSYEDYLKQIKGEIEQRTYTPVEERNNGNFYKSENNGIKSAQLKYNIATNNTRNANTEVANAIRSLTPLNTLTNPYKTRENLLKNNLSGKRYNTSKEKVNEIITHNTAQEIGGRLMSAPQTSLAYREKIAKQYENSTDFKNSIYEKEKEDFKTKSTNAINAGIEESYAKYNKDLVEAQNKDYNLWDKTGGRFISGMFKTINPNQGPQVKDERGDWYNLPTTQDIKDSTISDKTENGFLKFTGDVLSNTGRIASSAILNSILPGSGSTAYFSSMYMDGYNNARQNGYDAGKASIYATISTATEIVTEKLLGGATKAITGGKASMLNQGIAKGISKIMNNKTLINVLSHAGSEATEEFVQEYIDKITRNVVLDEENNVFSAEALSDALYSAAVGAVTGSFASIGDNSLNLPQYNTNLPGISNDNLLNTTSKPILPGINTNNQYSMQDMTMNNSNTYQYIKSDNSKIDNLRRSASEQKFNNSEQTTNFINMLEKIVSDKDIDIVFDSTLSNNVNGKYENGIITINPNSSRAGEFIAVHELTHAIGTDSMRKIVDNYRKSNPQFESALQSILKNYNTNELTDEAMSDVAGQLFGNQEFINNLSQTNPSLFKRIYNEIKYLWHQFTGYKNRNQFIEDLQYKWEQAYRSSNGLNKTSSYSIQKIENGTKYVNIDTDQSIFKGIDSKDYNKIAKMYINDYLRGETTLNNTDTAIIDSMTSKKYTNPGKKQPNFNEKMKLAPELKNVLEISEKVDDSSPTKVNTKYPKWEYYKIQFKLGNQTFEGLVNIGVDSNNNKHLYEVNNIKKTSGISETSPNRPTGFSTDNISQSGNNVKPDISSTKYSMQESQNNTQDNQGRTLTKEQQEYFKDSKVRDDNGNLRVLYNGSGEHTIYNPAYMSDESKWGKGIYLTPYKDVAEQYGSNIKEAYVNIKNPLVSGKSITFEQYNNLYKAINDGEEAYREEYDMYDDDLDLLWDITNKGSWADYADEIIKYTGKDGIIVDDPEFEKADVMVIAFKSNQVKNVDNANPTSNEDIRYSKQNQTWQEYLEDNFKASGTRTNMQDIKLPIKKTKVPLPKQSSNENIEISKQKTMNPNEISKLTKEDASTTPKLPTKKNVNKVGDGNSKFFDNILFKTDMLDSNSKKLILSDEDVKYYDKVTNKESLEKAFNKINNGGSAEVLNWNNKFQLDSEGKTKSTATATDIAEGWILMKQYQDAGDYDSMVQIAKTMRQIGTQAGQTIQAFNILERMTPEGMVKYAQSELSEAYDRMVKNKSKKWIDKYEKDFDLKPEEVAFIMDTMKEVSKMKDGYDKRVKLAEIQKVMTDKLPPEKGAGIKSWMRISMLFNPKTQVRNVLGNAVIAPVNYFSDLVSTVADKAISKKTGIRTTASTNLKQYTKGFKKGLFESYNDFKKGINTRDMQGNRFEIGQGKSFNNKTAIGKALNRVDSLLSFMLDAGDRGFYEASFTNSINNQMMINKTSEVTQEMIDIATQEALSRTWQDNNNYTKFVLDIRKGLNKLNVKGYGLGDILIPFAKTPANLTKAIVDYSPLGLVSTINEGIKLNKSLNNGQYNAQMQHKFVQNLGKALAGSMLYIAGYALAESGVISGESDDDKDVANFMKNTLGISNYSIKIGNKSFTYDWAQPIATPLAIMANYSKNKDEGASLQENITSILDTGLNVLFEQSFLESMSDILSESGEIGTKLQEQILDLPSRAIPTFMKQIADMVDGTTRTTFEKNKPLETAINKIKAKLPGVSKTLAPSTDTMGREIQKYGGKKNIFNVFLNPANVNTENISESAKEIYKIYKATGEKSVMPRVPEYSYKDKNGNEIKFTASDRSKFANESGKIIEKEIKNLMKNSEYQSMSNLEKAETIESIVNYSYNIAKNKVTGIELSDSYEKVYQYSKIGDVSDYYLFKANIDDSSSEAKKESIADYLIESDLNNEQLAFLYGNYYSSEQTLNNMLNINIPIKEFIKFDVENIEGEFDENTGSTKTNSKKNATINFVNSLNLNIAQKVYLIRTKYSSFKDYDKDILNYIKEQNIDILDKYKSIKEANIDSYDSEIIKYVNSQSMTSEEKQEILKEMGFTVRNGRVYY